MIRHRAKLLLAAGAALAITIPALAQDQPESLLPPGFEDPAPSPTLTPSVAENVASNVVGGESAVELVPMDQALADLIQQDLPPPIEMPDSARRDPSLVGPLPSSQTLSRAARKSRRLEHHQRPRRPPSSEPSSASVGASYRLRL